ncbi:MAG TPA: hypothetical protein VE862_02245 [Candidatus Acidoferrum sp.]|nr:hypothetical protein [Candidatus Acidoferrum sp.]
MYSNLPLNWLSLDAIFCILIGQLREEESSIHRNDDLTRSRVSIILSSRVLIGVTKYLGNNPHLVNRETLKKVTPVPTSRCSVNAEKAE